MSLDTTVRDRLLEQEYRRGKADALDLRSRAPEMDGTGVIAEERKVPLFDAAKDYSGWPVGSPVREFVDEEYQVFKLIQPYNAAHYTGTPAALPALWSICHTTDPAGAKPYIPPNGTSGMWQVDECCTQSGHVWRNNAADNTYGPSELPERWEDLGAIEQVQATA